MIIEASLNYFNPEMTVCSFKCPNCSKTSTLEVGTDSYISWRNGLLIQKAFPNLSSEQREWFVSGLCKECWDKIFAEDRD